MRKVVLDDGTIVLGVPDMINPDDEPVAELSCGPIKVQLPLTYWHHLRNCRGWGDEKTKANFYFMDGEMIAIAEAIEKEMWAQWDAVDEATASARLKRMLGLEQKTSD